MENSKRMKSIPGNDKKFRLRYFLAWGALLLTPAAVAWCQLQTPTGPPVDAIAITVTRFGPYPAAITHANTPFIIAVVNRSGALDDTFSLLLIDEQKNKKNILDLHSTPTKQRDHQTIDLLPGSYELRFKSHPDWVVGVSISGN